jgi:hypothetical protein
MQWSFIVDIGIRSKAVTVKNPILGNLHDIQANQLNRQLPALDVSNGQNVLSLWKYIEKRPHKFFSEFAMDVFLRELERLEKEDHQNLKQLIADEIDNIDNAFRHIDEINAFPWHDEPLQAEDDYRKLMLIDQNLNPAYLRLTEAVLKPLLMIPAYFSRIGRGKGTAKLDLYDISAELAGTDLNRLLQPYEALVRNGIAHGGVTYGANSIRYRDKKGNTKELRDQEVIQIFDDLLDVCNGMVAAISGFLLKQADSEYPRPHHLRLEELRAETQTPYWQVVGWLPAEQINGSQLIVYVEVNTLDYQKALFSSFQTAVLAERLAPGYDRYFLSLNQPSGWRGFGAFDGKNLACHRIQGHEIDQYSDVLEDTGLFFVPRLKLPKLFGKFGSLWLAFRVGKPLMVAQYQNSLGLCNVVVRHTELHRNSWGVVLKADVVLESSDNQIDQAVVRRQCRAIIRKSLRKARNERPYSSLLRYLPLGYARVHTFQKDFRRRKLANFGLAEHLVGTLQINRIKRIKAPDIAGSTIEYTRRVRIAWNRRWMDNQATADDIES